MFENRKTEEDVSVKSHLTHKRILNRFRWSGVAGLIFGLFAIIIVLYAFQKVPVDREGAFKILPHIAFLATFLTGSFLWWFFVSKAKTITIKRGVFIGMLIGLLSHLVSCYIALLFLYFSGAINALGERMHSFSQLLFVGLINSLTSISILGWMSVPIGGFIGGILAYIQGTRLTPESFKEISKTQKKFLFIAIIVIVLFSITCIHSDGSYKGKVVELETGKPIEGAVVAADWKMTIFAHVEILCDVRETVTDKNGEFELSKGWCINHPFVDMYKPHVVVFKPGFLGYPPLGYNQEQRKTYMPDFTGQEFRDEKEFYVIKLEKPKTKEERELTQSHAQSPVRDETINKLPILIKLVNEERKSLGLDEVYKKEVKNEK